MKTLAEQIQVIVSKTPLKADPESVRVYLFQEAFRLVYRASNTPTGWTWDEEFRGQSRAELNEQVLTGLAVDISHLPTQPNFAEHYQDVTPPVRAILDSKPVKIDVVESPQSLDLYYKTAKGHTFRYSIPWGFTLEDIENGVDIIDWIAQKS